MQAERSWYAQLMSWVAVFLLALTLPASAEAPAQSRRQPGSVSELRYTPHTLSASPADIGQANAALLALPLYYRDCTSIAYQAWQDDNWEIILARGDGTQPIRLTNNLTDDEAPSMGLGCAQIAFSADHDDNQDIYLMQSDGSGMQRLTSQPARDVLPALSPDGASVAFQSYRHGETPEVYVIDLASGAEARITNNQIYDGQPDWSPDSQQLAFISDESGIKNVWIMDRDGTNAHQVSYMPHAAAPKWSPDGQRIAFASDDIDTGFTSLWVVDQDGGDQRLVWRAYGSQTDAWPDDWSFDSRYILYEEANWEYDGGWYILSSSLDLIDPDQTGDRQRLVEGGVSMAATWALCDLAPPVAALAELDSISNPPISLSWSGQDDRSSYIEYQVQYRPGGQHAWTPWQLLPGLAWTPLTSGQFAWNSLGRSISFRVRARDLLGRVGAWAPNQDGAITTVPALISGNVADARGIPLPNATLSCLASTLPATQTAINGHYELAAASDWSSQLSATAPGYVGQSLRRTSLFHMSQINYRLTTGDESLPNGSFEAGLAGWYAAGAVAHIDPGYAFGKSCVLLGAGATYALAAAEPAVLGSSSVYQRLAIPGDTPYPTLSFAYALGDGSGGSQGALRVVVDDGGGGQQVFATTQESPWESTPAGSLYPLWQHAYVDLAPWQGETITVTLRHQQYLGKGSALLDQISVSPWRTPQVTSVSPSAIAVGQTAEVRVRGANLAASTQVRLGEHLMTTSWLGGDTLRVQIPGDIAPGQYDIWVSNPGGYASVKPLALSIGSYLKLPLIIGP